MAKKKKVKVGRKKSKSNLYFHSGTHDAIIKYQNSSCGDEKEKIYIDEILPAFDKLVENLIFIHGFTKTAGPYEELKNDCVCFLYETLHKFDASRGSKAFSYFNVVAKNWLIIKSKQKMKKTRRHVSIDDVDSLAQRDLREIESYNAVPPQDWSLLRNDAINNLKSLLREIRGKISGENEIACMDAIITLFEHIDELDLLNKRAVFVYMREISNLNPKQLSIAMSVIRKHYRVLIKNDDFDIFF
jgi:hypothetical protein